MIKVLACYIPSCSTCKGAMLGGDEEFEQHFPSMAEAVAALREAGWTVDETGRLTCPDCVNRALCASEGHDWTEWFGCACQGSNCAHGCTPEVATVEIRWCRRRGCSRPDHRPAVASGGGTP